MNLTWSIKKFFYILFWFELEHRYYVIIAFINLSEV